MKSSLSWSTALRIGWREFKASKAKFVFVLLSVAIGVASLTGVRGFSHSLQLTLKEQARSILGGDVSASMPKPASREQRLQLDALARNGVQWTEVKSSASMALKDGNAVPLLISLEAVDPSLYPLYGSLELQPAGELREVLNDGTVIVNATLLAHFNAKIDDSLRIAGHRFRIAAVMARDGNSMSGGMLSLPQVLMTHDALHGLGQQGVPDATTLYLFRITSDNLSLQSVRAQLQQILPNAQITDFAEGSPVLTETLNRITDLLSLICLVAMVLGAIGVAMAMRAHLQQRIGTLAIMKSIGAQSSDILRIYLLQTVLLGLVGGMLGVFGGIGVQYIFPTVLGKLLPMSPTLHLAWASMLTALAMGVLTAVIFCLPPLLDLRRIRPIMVLRRAVDSDEEPRSFVNRISENWTQWLSIIVILIVLCAIAAEFTNSLVVAMSFVGGLALLLGVTLGLSAIVLLALRLLLTRIRLPLPLSVRHGLTNLYRPGNQSSSVLAALGIGITLILTVFLMQESFVRVLRTAVPSDAVVLSLSDIPPGEVEDVKTLVQHQSGTQGSLQAEPIVSADVVSVDGISVAALKVPKRLLQSVFTTWADARPLGTTVISGMWWTAAETAQVAVAQDMAERLNLHLGSEIAFLANQQTLKAKVAAIYKVNDRQSFPQSKFIFAAGLLRAQPVVWYGSVRVLPQAVAPLEKALFASHPRVTVVNPQDILQTIQDIINQMAIVVHFLAGFSILSGLVILASTIASTRFRRVREVVIFKALGATRRRMASIFSVEFIVLGTLAGAVGAVFANVVSNILIRRMHLKFELDVLAITVAVLGTALLATFVGWLGSYQILKQRPLEILRDE